MSTSLGERQRSPVWTLTGLRVTVRAHWNGFSMELRLLASSSAETMESLVGTISRISPLDAELMLMASLSIDERASSSEV